MEPQLHLHAHVELDRSCNRCSGCCRRKRKKVLHKQDAVEEESSMDMYLRMKRLVSSKLCASTYSEGQMFEIVQLKARVRLYPHKMPSQHEIDRIAEACDEVAEIIKKIGLRELEIEVSQGD